MICLGQKLTALTMIVKQVLTGGRKIYHCSSLLANRAVFLRCLFVFIGCQGEAVTSLYGLHRSCRDVTCDACVVYV